MSSQDAQRYKPAVRFRAKVRSNSLYLRLICKLPVLSEANFVSNVNLLHAIAYANTFPLNLGTSLVEAYNHCFVHLGTLLKW